MQQIKTEKDNTYTAIVAGNGLVAHSMQNRQFPVPVLVFASGVSHSLEQNSAAFEREKKMLREQVTEHADKLLLYFSTISVFDPEKSSSPYVKHKLEMEALIKEHAPRFLILRLPNLIGKSNNPHTICNFFYHQILKGSNLSIKKGAERYLIDAEELPEIISAVMKKHPSNTVVNIITNRSIPVELLLRELEHCAQKKAKTIFVNAVEEHNESIETFLKPEETFVLQKPENDYILLLKKYYATEKKL